MNKAGADPKVRKTLVRNPEQKVKSSRRQIIEDVPSSSKLSSRKSDASKETELSEPSLCSSEAIAQYLTDARKLVQQPVREDLNIDKGQLCAKMTKKLNFHFNDRMYKNLVELNASVNEIKSKKEKRPSTLKKDLEPNIEDFYEDLKEFDSPPRIPVIRPKYKPIKKVENGDLHRLFTKFECL